jgi:hypothetical protein
VIIVTTQCVGFDVTAWLGFNLRCFHEYPELKIIFRIIFLMIMTRLMKTFRSIFVAYQHTVIIHVVVCYSLNCAKIVIARNN